MSATFFIMPYDPKAWEDPNDQNEKPTSDLRHDLVEFERKLLERWPGTQFDIMRRWKLCVDEQNKTYGMVGNWQNDFQVVAMKRGEGLPEFVIWYREYIPSRYQLFFFGDYSFRRLELKQGVTKEVILHSLKVGFAD